jgi:pimeloyl-ACP methyl ester carboxylesterase
MPIYYKKVKPNPNEVNFMEKGNRFSFGIRRKLANINSRSNKSDGLELDNIRMTTDTSDSPLIKAETSNNSDSNRNETNEEGFQERIITKYGSIVVVKQESNTRVGKPVIITYHDIGLNPSSNFESFFSISENKLLLESFVVYHVTAPGQEENAVDLPNNYTFPIMDELAEQILEVCKHYRINEFIGFGFGAGANILCRFALTYSDMVDGLFLINPSATSSTWSEWFYQKLNLRHLTTNPISDNCLPQAVQDYFIWHLFGNLNLPDRVTDNEAVDLYRNYFSGNYVNQHNLALFIDSYVRRTSLGISRSDKLNNFKCNVVVVCGSYSPHIEESIKMNARLIPMNSSWLKLSDSAMVLEEQPHKVAQALRLFLQGLGYTLRAFDRKRAVMTGMSLPCLTSSRLSLYPSSSRRATFGVINEV